jgi:folate-binding protein YgfZ
VSSIADQYRILDQRPGWVDRSDRGWLRVEGRDAVPFLHALVSNDVERLTPGAGTYAAYLTPQGRMIADLEILHRGDVLLAGVARGVAGPLASRLDQAIFAEDVRVSDVSGGFASMLVIGATAARIVSQGLDVDIARLNALPELGHCDIAGGFVMRSGEAPLDAFTVVVSTGDRGDTVGRLERAGAWPADDALATALRIAAGRPRFGVDMTEDTIPLEAGLLDRGISTTKGCYVGQEIVIRILHRGAGRVAKRLVTLAWTAESSVAPAAGTPLVADDRAVGHLTSVAPALTGDGWAGLGYVARDWAVIGRTVAIERATGTAAKVTGFAR